MAPVFLCILSCWVETSAVRKELISAIQTHQAVFGLKLDEAAIERLADHFEIVQEHNSLLHLVAPCSAVEFAVRHILESLSLLEHLPTGASFADVGSGAGLPSIPCLLVRDDLSALLIESKQKKARYLDHAIVKLGLTARAAVIDRQFEEVDLNGCGYVTCRAMDKFTERLPRLLKWAKGKRLLLFGGDNLAAGVQKQGRRFVQILLPLSERRYLLIVEEKRSL